MKIYLLIFTAPYQEFSGEGKIISKTAYLTYEKASSALEDFKSRCLEVLPNQLGTYDPTTVRMSISEIDLEDK